MTSSSLLGRLVTPWLSVALLATMVVAGAGCSESKTLPPADPIAREDFCAELTDALCDLVERCDCGAPAAARCRADFAVGCAEGLFGPEVDTSIAAGRLMYDPLAAGRAIANLRSEPPSCGHPVEALGFRTRDLLTFGGVLQGTLAAGATCNVLGDIFPNECRAGFCAGGTCAPIAGPGETCGPTTLCLDLDVPLVDPEDPSLELRCAGMPGATTGTCQGRLAGGAVCTNGDQCATGTCDASGACASPRATGATCDSDQQCVSARCLFGSSGGTCVAGTTADGAVCSGDEECASGACNDGACIAQACADYVRTPAPPPTPAP